VLSRVPYYQGY
jgi:hypothetical protein